MFKLAPFILWEFKSSEASSINEVENSINWLVIGFSLVRDVLALDQVYLERVQFVSEEWTQERSVAAEGEVQVVDCNRLHLVEFPSILFVFLGFKK